MEDEGYAYLDVRSVPEFEQGHPRGAINVPWLQPGADGMVRNHSFIQQVAALFAPATPIVVGCASGVRSLAAGQALEAHGFSRLVEQRAGFSGVRDPFGRVQERGWQDEALPISTERAQGHDTPER